MYYGVCENCGGETFAKYKSLLKRFCSHKCANIYNHKNVIKHNYAERVIVKCDNCGNNIIMLKNSHRYSVSKNHFFCDRKCMSSYYQSHPIMKKCEVCGKEFKKNRSQKTCSKECRTILLGISHSNGNISTKEEYEQEKKIREEKKNERLFKSKNRVNVYAGREKEYQKEYRAKNKSILYEKYKKRLKDDEIAKFKADIRKKVSTAFSRRKVRKQKETIEILGCSIEFFRNYIASKFKEGMSFDNYGEWHLDHIIPLATANTTEEVERLCHYSNYQPLWARENILKSNKLNWNG